MIQLPFAKTLVKISDLIIKGEDSKEKEVIYLDNRIIETPSIALGQVNKEVLRMGDLVLENLNKSREVLINKEYELIDGVLATEKLINILEREITNYLVRLSNASLSDAQHNEVNTFLYTINDLERMGDHIDNIIGLAQFMIEDGIEFSDYAKEALHEMFDKTIEAVAVTRVAFETNDKDLALEVKTIEDMVDSLEEKNRKDHIDRLNKGLCQTEPGIIFLDTLSNLERVSDHSLNIAMYVLDKYK